MRFRLAVVSKHRVVLLPNQPTVVLCSGTRAGEVAKGVDIVCAAGDDAGARAGGRENSANDVTMIVVGGAHSNCGPAHSPHAVIRHRLCPTAPFGDENVSTCGFMLSCGPTIIRMMKPCCGDVCAVVVVVVVVVVVTVWKIVGTNCAAFVVHCG